MSFTKKIIDAHLHIGMEKDALSKCLGNEEFWWTGDHPMAKYCLEAVRKYLAVPYPQVPPLTLEHLIESMDGGNVVKAVISGMDVTSKKPIRGEWPVGSLGEWKVPPEYIKECIDRYPDRFAGIVGVNPLKGKDYAIKELERGVKDFGMIGMKLFTPAGFYADDKELCYPLYEKCVELGIPVAIHAGGEAITGSRIKYSDPIYVDEVAVDFPELKIHMIHCGAGINLMAAVGICVHTENVYTCCSAPDLPLGFGGFPEWFRLIEKLIPDKFMFGTDYPMIYPHRTQVERIEGLGLGAEFLEKLFYENARRFYSLK